MAAANKTGTEEAPNWGKLNNLINMSDTTRCFRQKFQGIELNIWWLYLFLHYGDVVTVFD